MSESTDPAMAGEQPYQVLARKYRPQSFADVVGQDHVVTTLRNAIATERVAHAYLFVGPRGTGRTSTARIFAKELNCLDRQGEEPCNECDMCIEITEGRSLDVIEIDGASNNGVEQVRELRENVRFMPSRGKFKIYIIDEVHMLSTAAFNALLKTLEEPPEHVKFFFATTEAHKVPTTILSRCQRFDLRRIATLNIVERLQEICSAEKITAEEDALVAIARGAEGGMRDAQSALDQLISFQGKNITEQDVLSVFGLISHTVIAELAEAVLKGEMPTIVGKVHEFDQAGKDLQRLLFDLIEHFRNVLIYQYTENAAQLPDLTPAQVEAVKEQSTLCDPGRVTKVIDVLIQSEGRLRYALSRRTLLEMALIRGGRAALHSSIDEIMADLEALKAGAPLEEPKKKAP